jgi:hypothetical protein
MFAVYVRFARLIAVTCCGLTIFTWACLTRGFVSEYEAADPTRTVKDAFRVPPRPVLLG